MKKWFFILLCVAVQAHAQVPDLTVRNELNLPSNIFKTVLVTGVGDTPALARADAFRTAIEQAAGIVIATETQVANARVQRDQMATYSQARISNFAIVTMSKQAGIWVCQTWVTVRSACTQDSYSCTN